MIGTFKKRIQEKDDRLKKISDEQQSLDTKQTDDLIKSTKKDDDKQEELKKVKKDADSSFDEISESLTSSTNPYLTYLFSKQAELMDVRSRLIVSESKLNLNSDVSSMLSDQIEAISYDFGEDNQEEPISNDDDSRLKIAETHDELNDFLNRFQTIDSEVPVAIISEPVPAQPVEIVRFCISSAIINNFSPCSAICSN